ncbi:hypothetical protein M9H77_31579 [Catharanthus roseus]|uniref:Uncharacterized protein n=1 Tax=Catharanthus roseus TaxID=4058 RepID=A0ACC0A361_CATRO|nr:hypothetical protein M9H77_31579 [Catharanthus roseus]
MGEISTKENKLSEVQDVTDRKVIHHEKKKHLYLSKRRKIKRGKSEESCEYKRRLKEEQEKEKQDEIKKSEETKEEMSLMIFEGKKREEMKDSCDTSLPLNSLSSEEYLTSTLELLNYNLWNKAKSWNES